MTNASALALVVMIEYPQAAHTIFALFGVCSMVMTGGMSRS